MANYSLRDNPLTDDPNDKIAQLEGVRSYTKDEIIERILNRGNTMTRTDLLAAINAYAEEVAFITAEGSTVNTPLLNTSLSITGVFTSGDDMFDQKRHSLKVNVSAGSALRDAALKVRLTKVQGASTGPWITGVRDTLSAAEDVSGLLRAGSVIEISGSRLKFDAADGEQGVFLVSGGGETRCEQVIENKPSRVLAVLPAVAPGEYTVELRTRNTGSRTGGRLMKKGTFERTVTVTA